MLLILIILKLFATAINAVPTSAITAIHIKVIPSAVAASIPNLTRRMKIRFSIIILLVFFDIDIALTLAFKRLTSNIDFIDVFKTLDEMDIGEKFEFCFETVTFKGKNGSKFVIECVDGSNCYLDENKNFYKMKG